jgi:hypothetical protein
LEDKGPHSAWLVPGAERRVRTSLFSGGFISFCLKAIFCRMSGSSFAKREAVSYLVCSNESHGDNCKVWLEG